MTIEKLLERESSRREKRNLRDRLARGFLAVHPEVRLDPNLRIEIEDIPEGTTEAAIRSIAKFYKRQSIVREILRERKKMEGAL